MPQPSIAALSILAVTAALLAISYIKYWSEMSRLRKQLLRGSQLVDTSFGFVEYAERGKGPPLFLIHGAGGGYDQGLIIGRNLADTHRVIAPSRFGYLRTQVPQDPSPERQAEAHAELLKQLEIKSCIIAGVSAGAPSALEFALRFPERTQALLLIVPRTYDPTQAIGPDDRLGSRIVRNIIESSADFLFWTAMHIARAHVVRFLGVRPELEAQAAESERQRVTEFMRSLLPLSDRKQGLMIDATTRLSQLELSRITVPTLIISAKDDLFKTLPGATFTAEHITSAELRVLESGGHLMVGQTAQVRAWIAEFLNRPALASASDAKAGPLGL